jgi:hypothetical protein
MVDVLRGGNTLAVPVRQFSDFHYIADRFGRRFALSPERDDPLPRVVLTMAFGLAIAHALLVPADEARE